MDPLKKTQLRSRNKPIALRVLKVVCCIAFNVQLNSDASVFLMIIHVYLQESFSSQNSSASITESDQSLTESALSQVIQCILVLFF